MDAHKLSWDEVIAAGKASPLENLSVEVVRLAITDYKKMVKYYYKKGQEIPKTVTTKHPYIGVLNNGYSALEFFLSEDDLSLYTKLDGKLLIRYCIAAAIAEVEEAKRKAEEKAKKKQKRKRKSRKGKEKI